jgi:nucleoside 2-deoxyribosyltransferase
MMVVYVAGPYRGKTVEERDGNIIRAGLVAVKVWESGAVAFCPHLNAALFDGILPEERFLAGGLEMVRRCDALVLVAGWQGSAGTLAEIELANRLGKPVFRTMAEFLVATGHCRRVGTGPNHRGILGRVLLLARRIARRRG